MSALSDVFARDLALFNSPQDGVENASATAQAQTVRRAEHDKIPRFIKLMVSLVLDRDAIAWLRSRQPQERDAVSKVVNNYFTAQMSC